MMEQDLWEKLLTTLEQVEPDIPRIGKPRNKHACIRLRNNIYKSIKLLRAINGLVNTY